MCITSDLALRRFGSGSWLGPRTLNFSERIFSLKSIGPLNDSQLKLATYSENIEKFSGKCPGHKLDLSLTNRLGSENKFERMMIGRGDAFARFS
jgi:hypothetical protein